MCVGIHTIAATKHTAEVVSRLLLVGTGNYRSDSAAGDVHLGITPHGATLRSAKDRASDGGCATDTDF